MLEYSVLPINMAKAGVRKIVRAPIRKILDLGHFNGILIADSNTVATLR